MQGSRRTPAMLIGLGVVAVSCVAADLVVSPTPGEQLILLALVAVAAGVAALSTLRRPAPAREVWLLFWLLLEFGGSASAFALQGIRGAVGFPSIADAFWILGGVSLVVALVARIRRAVPLRDPTALLDATVVATSVGVVLWATAVAPGVGAAAISLPARLTSVAYPVLDIATLGLLGYLWGASRDRRRDRLLAAGVTLLLASDLLFALRSTSGFSTVAGPVRPTALAAVLLLAAAAVRGARSEDAPALPRPQSFARVWMLVAATLIPLTLVTLTSFDDWLFPASELPMVLLVATVLVVAMSCRLVVLLGRSGRLASTIQQHRFEALAHASTDVVAIVGADRRFRYVSPTTPASWQLAPPELVGERVDALIGPEDRVRFDAQLSVVMTGGRGTSRTVEVAVDPGIAEDGRAEVIMVNLLEDPTVEGIGLTIRDVTQRIDFERELRSLAFHDGLTGMANRALFAHRLETALEVVRAAPSRRTALIFVDLDDFKGVNDSLGHSAGDDLLVEISRRIESCTREHDTTARIGGDEFAVLVEDLEQESELEAIATRIVESLRRPVSVHGSVVSVGGSVGVRMLDASTTPTVAMRDADLAMYRAKSRGKNRFEIYAPEMHAAALASFELRSELEEAVRANQLVLHYQTIHELGTHRLVGAEALIRWQHPERGLVLPSDFIEVAEQSGLIVPIGGWVLAQACQDIAQLNAASAAPLWVSVNVSPLQFSAAKLTTVVRNALLRARVPAELLRLEITESLLLENSAENVQELEELRAMGAKIAIDDFGTGYSSMAYLQRYPVDVVKIDRSFVGGAAQSAAGVAITESILRLTDALGLACVAEGIESAHDQALLSSMGCRYGQGFLYSRPMPLDEFLLMLAADAAGSAAAGRGALAAPREPVPAQRSEAPPALAHGPARAALTPLA